MNIALLILLIYIVAVMQMHYRGKVRLSVPRQFLTHTNYLAPYNLLMNLFSTLPNKPLLNTDDLAELKVLRDNWEVMRDEALQLAAQGEIKAADGLNDAGFNSFFKTGWTRYYLKWYGDPLDSAERQCPKTIEILKQVPSVKAAMFASLPPGGLLTPHRDPFAGALRYHLGLVTPNHDDCYILVDGEKHVWHDGKDVLFDETFIHEAHNNTDTNRIILFCDVNRPMKLDIINKFNTFMSSTLMRATATRNDQGDPVGMVNRVFSKVYSIRVVSRRIKRWNKPFYKVLKYTLFLTMLYLVFF
ncbi:MAG: aspartyl/asparaginyl beta-hydroxylase domain-containing protein [Arenicella sp.]|nr:aspartyl/asparaginyl beta-hydroxylase domain-containing protein [Arenicella sp.]